jgi:glycosyltransferase involved in cell wall biosynthesis
MRILMMGPYPPPHGGVQTNLVAIRTGLGDRAIPSLVINLTRHRRPEADGVYYPRSAFQLLGLLFKLPYDVIHLHFGGNLTSRLLGLAFLCTLVPRARTVLTFHSGGYPESEAGRRAGPRSLAGFILRRVDRLIGVNRELAQFFRRLGVEEQRINVIEPHSVTSIDPSQPLSPELAQFMGSHSPVLTTVGLLEPEYDLALQIDAMESVRVQFPDAGLLIIGSGSIEAELRSRIADKSYSSHVLLAGDVPHPVTLSAIKSSDVLLRTTRYDGDSVAVREALYFGVPVIATDNGMRPAGPRLIPIGDEEKLVSAIGQTFSATSSDLRPTAGSDGGESGERNVTAVIQIYRELYNDLCPGVRQLNRTV